MTKQRPISFFISLIILLVSQAFSQNKPAVEKLHAAFQDFKYEQVIFWADSIIVNSSNLEKKDLLEIYRLKAVSHYSIGQQHYSELTFKSILQVDSNYVLQPSINAPKIILLFKKIKESYKPVYKQNKEQFLLNQGKVLQIQNDYIAAAGRSVIFPGWGHNYLGKKAGNWFLAGSAVLIPLSIYFTAASWHYEQEYLNEIDAQKIAGAFKKFDDIYTTRNIILGAYLLYWAYIQYDFFNQNDTPLNEAGIVLNLYQTSQRPIQLSLTFSF